MGPISVLWHLVHEIGIDLPPDLPCRLLPLVRFPLMSDAELAALSEHPLRHRSAVLGDLLAEAQRCHAADEARQLQGGADSIQQVGVSFPCHADVSAPAAHMLWR
jgi:hypothetical protein